MKRLLTVFVVLFSAVLAAPGARAVDLDSLLIKSVGGPDGLKAYTDMKYYTVTGRVNMYGQRGTFVEHVIPPSKLYLEMKFDAYSVTQGYDGAIAWQTDLNGQVTEMTGFERKELLKTVYFETASFIVPNRVPGTKKFEGLITHSDTTFYQVAFVPAGTDTVRVLYDTALGLPRIKLADMDNTRTINVNSDFRTVNGAVIPFYSKLWGIDTPIEAEFWTDAVTFNDLFDTTIFSKPTDFRTDYSFPSESTQVTIPFEYHFGHIYVAAAVNGVKKGKFILDSGCSASVFHNGFIAGLKLPPAGTMPAKGVGGFDSFELLRTDSIQIGPVTLYRQIVGSSDLSGIGRGDTLPFGGIIGYDFLSRFPILIDYSNELITIFNPTKFTPPSGGKEVPFTLTMQVPTVKARLLDLSGDFIVDLGNAYGLLIHNDFAAKNNLAARLSADTSSARALHGVGGGISGVRATLDHFQLDSLVIDSLPVVLSSATEGMTGSEIIAGNIGNEILQRYRILFDYQRERLIFY